MIGEARRSLRTDIQALRGLAVLLVLLYHAELGAPRAGYLGVDIFFVISGYLITGLIRREIEQGTFSLARFYARRARRLLPAAYVTFLVTLIAAVPILSYSELRDLIAQIIGAVTFTSNIVFWRQADYFASAAQFKPLLHIWSLSLEEQYYLLLPLLLLPVPRRLWTTGAALAILISLALCLLLAPWKMSAAFYLLPTRAWELAVGSLGALLLDRLPRYPTTVIAFWPALLVLVTVPLAPAGTQHPGVDAALVCAATLVVILRRHHLAETSLPALALARIGNVSYSLYLVHWPIFAFASNIFVGQAPLAVRLLVLALSFMLGYALYRHVEEPMRRVELRSARGALTAALAVSILMVALPIGAGMLYSADSLLAAGRHPNFGLSPSCNFADGFVPRAECQSSGTPELLIWGDSQAMSLARGLAATASGGIVQATRSLCGPFLDLAPVPPGKDWTWSEQCIEFAHSVYEYLARTPTIKTVVLASSFNQYVDGSLYRLLERDGDVLTEQQAGIEPAARSLGSTVERLRALGKRVVVVAPPPRANFDVGLCLERLLTGKLLLGLHADCTISVTAYRATMAPVSALIAAIQDRFSIGVVRLEGTLCQDMACVTFLDGKMLYADASHLSVDGSVLVARRMPLAQLVLALAR